MRYTVHQLADREVTWYRYFSEYFEDRFKIPTIREDRDGPKFAQKLASLMAMTEEQKLEYGKNHLLINRDRLQEAWDEAVDFIANAKLTLEEINEFISKATHPFVKANAYSVHRDIEQEISRQEESIVYYKEAIENNRIADPLKCVEKIIVNLIDDLGFENQMVREEREKYETAMAVNDDVQDTISKLLT